MNERGTGAWWIENGLRPAMIAAMTACLATPFVLALEAVLPDLSGAYFLLFAFGASLEGILGERLFRTRRVTGEQYLVSRAAELLLLLLLLKLVSYVPLGFERFQAELLRWPPDPAMMVRGLDVLSGLLLAALWVTSIQVARLAIELDEESGKGPPPPDHTSAAYYLWLTGASLERDRQTALDRLGDLFLMGGMAMLLALGALHALQVPTALTGAYALLLYFALGVGLVSQARFSVARAAWQMQGIPVQAGVGRRWLVWATVFVVAVAALALLLPVDYAAGPLAAARGVLGWLLRGLMFLLTLFFFLLSLPLSLLKPGAQRTPPSPPQLDLSAPQPGAVTGVAPWLQTAGAALLWALAIAVVVYALFRFARDRLRGRGAAAGSERAQGLWGRVRRLLRDLWRRWWGWLQGVQQRVVRRLAGRRHPSAEPGAPGRFLSLRRLSPRDLVRYFYLSAARRAARAGQPRRPGQTPYEYRQELERRFPELEPDLDGLTHAFVQARYSRRPVNEGDAQAVKPLWQRIRAALRRRAKPGAGNSHFR